MEFPKYTKLVEDFINDKDAMSLLFNAYQASPNDEDRDKLVLAIIGHAVTTHKLLQFHRKT